MGSLMDFATGFAGGFAKRTGEIMHEDRMAEYNKALEDKKKENWDYQFGKETGAKKDTAATLAETQAEAAKKISDAKVKAASEKSKTDAAVLKTSDERRASLELKGYKDKSAFDIEKEETQQKRNYEILKAINPLMPDAYAQGLSKIKDPELRKVMVAKWKKDQDTAERETNADLFMSVGKAKGLSISDKAILKTYYRDNKAVDFHDEFDIKTDLQGKSYLERTDLGLERAKSAGRGSETLKSFHLKEVSKTMWPKVEGVMNAALDKKTLAAIRVDLKFDENGEPILGGRIPPIYQELYTAMKEKAMKYAGKTPDFASRGVADFNLEYESPEQFIKSGGKPRALAVSGAEADTGNTIEAAQKSLGQLTKNAEKIKADPRAVKANLIMLDTMEKEQPELKEQIDAARSALTPKEEVKEEPQTNEMQEAITAMEDKIRVTTDVAKRSALIQALIALKTKEKNKEDTKDKERKQQSIASADVESPYAGMSAGEETSARIKEFLGKK